MQVEDKYVYLYKKYKIKYIELKNILGSGKKSAPYVIPKLSYGDVQLSNKDFDDEILKMLYEDLEMKHRILIKYLMRGYAKDASNASIDTKIHPSDIIDKILTYLQEITKVRKSKDTEENKQNEIKKLKDYIFDILVGDIKYNEPRYNPQTDSDLY